jgi:N-acetylmuramoyl-L-alanine amidase
VTDDLDGAVSALNGRRLSYHILIEPDGTVNQTRPFHKHAAHCGYSNWKRQSGLTNASSLNRSAISVTFINRGYFRHFSGEHYYDANSHGDPVGDVYPADAVVTTSSDYHPKKKRYWHKYTAQQLAAGREVIAALVANYPAIAEIAGHDDVSNNAKFDTGPLFPIDAIRTENGKHGTLGFRAIVDSSDGTLVLRQRPTGSSTALRTLLNGDVVHIRTVVYTTKVAQAIWHDANRYRYLTKWGSVGVDGNNRHAGFVHLKYLSDTPLTADYQNRL